MQGWTQTPALAAVDSRGAPSETLTEGACATSSSISTGFCCFAVVQGHKSALSSAPVWVNTKSSIPDMENICLG